MMTHSNPRPTRISPGRACALAITALTLGQAGCGREFFREWANQDVAEAVFEKSRDPRWRLDLFTVDPPALARFSDPYDPDRPPAPPDDRATEATSPVPQWPDNRLLVPPEGTGYLDMLTEWQRERPDPPKKKKKPDSTLPGTDSTPPASGTTSPFSPPPPTPQPANPDLPQPPNPPVIPPSQLNSGTTPDRMTPIPSGNPEANPANLPPPTPMPDPAVGRPQAKNSPRDPGVTLSAFYQAGLPFPVPPVDPNAPAARPTPPRRDPLVTPPIGMDPDPKTGDTDLAKPDNPKDLRPDLPPGEYQASEKAATTLGYLIPGSEDFDDVEAAGLPTDSKPFVINMEQAFTLTLINSRVYQFNLEQIYLSALAVTLQRFAFTPQFYAGLSPSTAVPNSNSTVPAAFPGTTTSNVFNYATKQTGAQVSTLNLGTMAGYGQAFSSGGRLLAGFANQLVFNFIGKNAAQPKVTSYLPLSFYQPFLRGGGRAVTLEPLTLAERSLLYQIRSFAKFRQEFTVASLVGGSITNFGSSVNSLGFTGGGNSDPTVGFVNIIEDVQLVENYRRNIAAYERLKLVYAELIKGEASGLSRLQYDQIDSSLQGAKIQFLNSRLQYRSDLDGFKTQMGLPPDTPLIPDRGLTQRFHDVYEEIDNWQRNGDRKMDELPFIIDKLPKLEDVVIDGRSLQGIYTNFTEGDFNEDALEDLLLTAERTAVEHRLDLMNTRAQLYDSWRNLKVTANALQGVFNVTLTNQLITPPVNTNPFGFIDQAKQFSLVFNAELPLVRVNERNNFRNALIGYQRQRRALQNAEDALKLNIRNEIRGTQNTYLQYEISKRNLVLTIRQKDQAFEQIVAPPQGAAVAGSSQAPLQTTNLIQFQGQLINLENTLVSLWYAYQSARLQLFRDLGTLPIDEWEAFSELFANEPISAGPAAAARGARAAGAAAVNDNPSEESEREQQPRRERERQ